MRSGRKIGKQKLDIALAHILLIDLVGRTGITLNPTCDFKLVLLIILRWS